MDGKLESTPQPPQSSSPPSTPKVFACPGCGNSLTIRGMQQTESIVCDSCGSVIDLTDENFRIIETYQAHIKYAPLIPLGTRGKIRGELFEAIGYLRRKIEVEGVEYEWSEYLLFNPYKGFRWLTEYNGHWNYVRITTNAPEEPFTVATGPVRYLGQTFRHFPSAVAQVCYVVGEFYWKVAVGETCTVHDYVAPPYILSKEVTDREVSWSVGDYLEPEIVWSSFQLKTPIPPRIGVAPNQPSPFSERAGKIWRLWTALFFLLVFLQLLFLLLSQNKLVYQNTFAFHQADVERAQVTDIFEVTGRPSNVIIDSRANVDNSWIYLNLALINEETGNAYDFGREISYYHGFDGGESWKEGSVTDEAVLPTVPAGRYYLRIEPEAEVREMTYSIRVYRDVPRWTYFFMALGGLLLIPFFLWSRSRSFEYRRWSESDHPMVTSSEED
ncbi:MAG: DUF4178 domain-containing protein [Terriglobia bacterium]